MRLEKKLLEISFAFVRVVVLLTMIASVKRSLFFVGLRVQAKFLERG